MHVTCKATEILGTRSPLKLLCMHIQLKGLCSTQVNAWQFFHSTHLFRAYLSINKLENNNIWETSIFQQEGSESLPIFQNV